MRGTPAGRSGPNRPHRSSPSRDSTRTEDRLLALVELAYDAASDRGRWPNLLEGLADTLRCQLVAFDVQDRESQATTVQCHFGPRDAALQREYESYYAARNIFIRTRPDLTYTGAIRNGEAIVPDDIAQGRGDPVAGYVSRAQCILDDGCEFDKRILDAPPRRVGILVNGGIPHAL